MYTIRISYAQHSVSHNIHPHGETRGPFASLREASAAAWEWLAMHHPVDADQYDGDASYDFGDGVIEIVEVEPTRRDLAWERFRNGIDLNDARWDNLFQAKSRGEKNR